MRFSALVSMVAAASMLAPQTTVPQSLAAEMDRIRAEAAGSTPEDQRAVPGARLERAKAALDANRILLALYLLEMPWENAKGWTFVKSSSAVTTAAAFASKWSATGEPRAAATRAGRRPALVDAVAAAAEARGATTYFASLPYGEDSGVAAGLYYLGESHAVMQFAAMARSLPWPTPPAPPVFRSIAAELAALDGEMTTAYETMDRSNHSSYIVASAALKQAKTLNSGGQHAAALLQYLLSRYVFAPLRGPARQDATPERIAAARAALSASTDHSIAELFLQLADEGVSGGTPPQRRAAAAALEDVVPAYFAALATPAMTAAPATTTEVAITLVRWPFT